MSYPLTYPYSRAVHLNLHVTLIQLVLHLMLVPSASEYSVFYLLFLIIKIFPAPNYQLHRIRLSILLNSFQLFTMLNVQLICIVIPLVLLFGAILIACCIQIIQLPCSFFPNLQDALSRIVFQRHSSLPLQTLFVNNLSILSASSYIYSNILILSSCLTGYSLYEPS